MLLTGRRVERDCIVGGEVLLRKLLDPPSIPSGVVSFVWYKAAGFVAYGSFLSMPIMELMSSGRPSSRCDVQNQYRYHY